MTTIVLDASVVVKWFRSEHESDVEVARAIRREVQAQRLAVIAPFLLHLELINVAARRWKWGAQELGQLSRSLINVGFSIIDPPLAEVARWTSLGLTSYDATYVAVASTESVRLVTGDERILAIAPHVAQSLASFPT